MDPRASNAAVAHRLSAVAVVLAYGYLLLSTTIGFRWIEAWHDEQRAVQIILLATVAILGGLLAARASSQTRVAPSMLIALGLGVASACISGHAIDALTEVGLTALLVTLALVVSVFVRTSPIDVALWTGRAALFLAAAHVTGGFTRYAAALETGTALGTEIWMLGFSNPRVASAFYALLIPLVAMSTVAGVESDRRLRWTGWIVLACLWAVASGLQARALWFSYAIAIPALLVILPSRPVRRVVAVLVVTAAIGVAIQWALPLPGSDFGEAGMRSRELTSLTARDVLWRLAIDATLQAPLLGIGPGEFARLGSFAGSHPHNWILQLACEWGLPALVAVLLGLAGLVKRIRSTRETATGNGRLLPAAVLATFVGLASSLVDGTLVMPTSQVVFAVAFGLMLGALGFDVLDAPQRRSATRVAGGMVAALLLATSVLVMHRAAVTYREQPGETVAFRQRFPGQWLAPRFWESGLKLVETSSVGRR